MKSTSFITDKEQKRRFWGIAIAIIALAIPFFIGHNHNHIEDAQSLCPVKMASGMPCPGCGITKSIFFFYTGNFLKSLHYHLFGIPFILFCVASIITLSLEIFTGKSYFRKYLFNIQLGYSLGLLLSIYHLIRLVQFISTHSIDEILKESIWK